MKRAQTWVCKHEEAGVTLEWSGDRGIFVRHMGAPRKYRLAHCEGGGGLGMDRADIFQRIHEERLRQDAKWGSLEEKQQSVAGYLVVLEGELAEAKQAWLKNTEGKHSTLNEVLQVAAVAVACLEQWGIK